MPELERLYNAPPTSARRVTPSTLAVPSDTLPDSRRLAAISADCDEIVALTLANTSWPTGSLAAVLTQATDLGAVTVPAPACGHMPRSAQSNTVMCCAAP